MRLFQIRLLYWKKSLILIQEKNTYDNGSSNYQGGDVG